MRRTRHRLLVAVMATLVMVLAACGGDSSETADPAADAPAEDGEDAAGDGDGESTGDEGTDGSDGSDESEESEGSEESSETDDGDDEPAGDDMASATVAVASSDLGDIVVNGEGRTLYMFVPDEGGEPTCTDDCAAAWPVFEGPATAGDGVDGSLLATATHPSGATQATYGGWPLYYFANDAAPGDINGQGVNDVWFVLGPDGEPIRDDASASGQGLGY